MAYRIKRRSTRNPARTKPKGRRRPYKIYAWARSPHTPGRLLARASSRPEAERMATALRRRGGINGTIIMKDGDPYPGQSRMTERRRTSRRNSRRATKKTRRSTRNRRRTSRY
jgi:hypothetical protein